MFISILLNILEFSAVIIILDRDFGDETLFSLIFIIIINCILLSSQFARFLHLQIIFCRSVLACVLRKQFNYDLIRIQAINAEFNYFERVPVTLLIADCARDLSPIYWELANTLNPDHH